MRFRAVLAAAAVLVLASALGAGPPQPSRHEKPVASASAPARDPIQSGSMAHLLSPKGAIQSLTPTDAAFLTTQDGWVVGAEGGQDGFVARTVDSGANWSIAQVTGTIPTQVLFVSPKVGFTIAGPRLQPGHGSGALGSAANAVLRSLDGGRTWSGVLRVRGTITGLAQAGSGGILASVYGSCGAGACPGAILLSGSGGVGFRTLWTAPGPVLAVDAAGQNIWAIVALSARPAVAVRVYRSVDGGRSFAPVATLPTGQELGYLPSLENFYLQSQLRFTSPTSGWATLYSLQSCAMHGCGVSDVFHTSDGGVTWQRVSAPTVACQFEPQLAVSGDLVAVAQGVNLGACAGPEVTLFLSTDGGRVLHVAQRWPELGLWAIGFLPDGRMWALGQALMLEAPGGSWQQSFPALVPNGPMDFVTKTLGYAAGDPVDPGAVLRTTDGGRSWQLLTSLPGMQIGSIDFSGPSDGLLSASSAPGEGQLAEILRTADGGRTWQPARSLPRGNGGLVPVRLISRDSGLFLNLSVPCTSTCAPTAGMTGDGGRTWSVRSLSAPPVYLEAAQIISPGEYVAGSIGAFSGPGLLIASEDGGRTWFTLASLPFRVASVGIDFVSPDVGFVLVDTYGEPTSSAGTFILLSTSDGGRVWARHDFRGRLPGPFASISFVDARHGWLLSASTLWSTSDGGLTWTEVHDAARGL